MAQSSPILHFHQCLGRGGFGEVYLATIGAGDDADYVAVKVLQQGLDARGQAVQRITDEARLLHLLEHPSILEVHDLIAVAGRVALVMEYLPGQDLEDLLLPPHTVPMAAGLQVMAHVARALHAAYTTVGPRGEPLHLLHRDIKPGNIRLAPDGSVKVLDFGIAKASGVTREAKTQATSVVGSFAYMAPERFRPREGGTPRGDVYSIGAVLFEILSAGRMLYEGYELRDLFSLAMMPDERMGVVQRQLGTLDAPQPVLDLLLDTVREDPRERPDLLSLADRLEGLVPTTPGRSLVDWAHGRVWPPDPSGLGELSDQALPYRSLGVQRRKRVRKHGAPTPPPIAKQPIIRSLPEPGLHDAKTVQLPPREPSSPPEKPRPPKDPSSRLINASITPVGPPPRAPVEPHSSRGWVAMALVALLGLGVLVSFTAVGVVVATTLRDPASGAPTIPDPPSPPTPEPVVPPPAPALPSPSPSQLAAPSPAPAPAPAPPPTPERPRPAPDRPPEPSPSPAVPSPVPGPPPEVAAACRDLLDLLDRAGSLTEEERTCLGEGMRDVAQRENRILFAEALLDDGWARCQAGKGCAAYERDAQAFLASVSQSDQRRMLQLAGHLLKTAANDPDRLQTAAKWARRALERERSGVAHETLARATYQRWQVTRDAAAASEAIAATAAWAGHLRSQGISAEAAEQLCTAAGGDPGTCTAG